ncbi:MAG: energy transducer TonB [Bacteroidales bacterium]|nr:energy transducer TonB [Bacteroidales bacterium]
MIKKLILGFILFSLTQGTMAQTTDTIDCDFWWPEGEEVLWGVPEQMPNFPGGETALMKYISEHLVYPQEAKDAGVVGRVYIGVVVMEDGSLACTKVLKGLGHGCDEAALEVFKDMPKWMPAMQRGKAICYPYEVPFFFGIVEQEMIHAVEKMPEYPGGFEAMFDFINANLDYPQEAKDAAIEGKVFVSFIVEKDGSLSSIKLLRGIGYGCDEAAMDVVRKMPKWKPAIQRGKPVRVQYQLPFNFKLENEKQK